MTERTVLANAKVILPEDVFTGAVTLEGERIVAIDQGPTTASDAIDCGGDYVMPGLIELHTDNLERHIEPRPKVDWPHGEAIIAHDAELASVGITTVFDAMRVGSIPSGKARYKAYARALASELLEMRDRGVLRISHFLHLRAEICSETLPMEMAEFGPQDRVGIVSLMDHTPGQRQFRDMTKLRHYVMGKNNMSEEDWKEHVERLQTMRASNGDAHERIAVEEAGRYGAILASHDDTTVAHVEKSVSFGCHFAEFPTTEEAADACHEHGVAVMMGAPNLIRGGSHSGNVAAHVLADRDRLDILSSDYVPSALLSSALILGDRWGDLARGIRTVTKAPADATDLHDRGRLEIGARADVIRVHRVGQAGAVRGVWVQGRRVA